MRRPQKKKMAAMIATAARTPMTIPAIAPPDREEPEWFPVFAGAEVVGLVVADVVVAVFVVEDVVAVAMVVDDSVDDEVDDAEVGDAEEDGTLLLRMATP